MRGLSVLALSLCVFACGRLAMGTPIDEIIFPVAPKQPVTSSLSLSGPLILRVINTNGPITVMGIEGESLQVIVRGVRFTPDEAPAVEGSIAIFEGNKILVGVQYPEITVPLEGTVEDYRTLADPAKGIVLTPNGLVIAGNRAFRNGVSMRLPRVVRGSVGEAELTVGVPKDQLAHLWVETKSGRVKVTNFPEGPLSAKRIVHFDLDLGVGSVENVVAGGALTGLRGESPCEAALQRDGIFDFK